MRKIIGRLLYFSCIALSLAMVAPRAIAQPDTAHPGVWVRVTLLKPAELDWRTYINVRAPRGAATDMTVGANVVAGNADSGYLHTGQATPWIDLSKAITAGVASVRFIFQPKQGELTGVQAKFDVATAATDASIVRSITESDTKNLISLRIPADLAKDRQWLLSIREDTERRLAEVKAFHLPAGPLPQKIWTMTGFRSNGDFYNDPAIAQMDFDIIRLLGMNAYWEQNGGQPGELRKMAQARGINRSTVYWRNIEGLPRTDGELHLDWTAINDYIDKSYHSVVENTKKAHPYGMPDIVVDLADEPAGLPFTGQQYQDEFHAYLTQQGLTPAFFGKASWNDVTIPQLTWWNTFQQRAAMIPASLIADYGRPAPNIAAHHLFYWSLRFWNYATARTFSLATHKALELYPAVGTRVNFGPPWMYDYGTLPRGIDAFEFGRQQGVTLGFNEDWVGSGNPRTPLETNTLLMDWSRAAARPVEPLMGSYITRDADRETVKLRTFGCLARNAKIFDFYYYGPAYTFFDHWSDNISMVQGVGEVTRDIGQVDDLLWAGRPPKAEVALLYSKSWPVWKEDDTEENEQVMTYLSLLHAGIPVDIVSSDEIADGSFAARKYKCLYVVNESIPAAAATAIDKWVQGGGRLWLNGWAGMRDEYNTPTNAWNAMLAIKSRSWKPTGDLTRLGQPIKPDDYRRSIFGRAVTLEPAAPVTNMVPLGVANGGQQAYRRKYGAGSIEVVPWAAGKEYMDAAVTRKGSLTQSILYPATEKRTIVTGFALESKVQPPATTSVNGILAWPLMAQQKGVILLANYTGEPAANVTVRFTPTGKFRSLRSLRLGALKFTRPDKGHVQVTLPMADVTDILVIE